MPLIKISISRESDLDSKAPTEKNQVKAKEKQQDFSRKHNVIIRGIIMLAAIIIGIVIWRLFIWAPEINPFTARMAASVNFTLYYPTSLPPNFHTDSKNITEPQANTIMLTIDGPKDEKIYMSEEKRPSTFDLGGFYKNFSDLHTYVQTNGEIAVGHVGNGVTEIGSIAFTDTNTWVLANTNTPIPSTQWVTIFKDLRHN